MKKHFKVGDHVEWNSEAGHVRGTIKKKITSAIKFKSYTVRASKEVPQVLDPKRHNQPSGHAQRCGSQKDRKKRRRLAETVNALEEAMKLEEL